MSPGSAPPATRSPAWSRSARAVRGAAAALVVAVPVTLLALLVREQFDPLVRFDTDVIRRATGVTRDAGLTGALVAVQELTQPKWLHLVGSLVCLWVWRAKGLRSRAVWAFATLMVGWFVGYSSKLLVQRARPVVDDPVSHASGYSFPSGHALNSAVFASVMVVLLWPLLSRTARRVAVGLAGAGVLLVGLDRVLLGVHYPSDVLAGFLLGLGITFSSWIAFIGKTAVTSSPGSSSPPQPSGP
ncbi:MAG TPA: phosphatase PAP2 family protein [Pedococcus sp.]